MIALINDLAFSVGPTLVGGETLDLQYSNFDVEHVGEEAILDMIRKKTGALYEFSGRAGAMVGINQYDLNSPIVRSLSQYAVNCGIAFQLQDDILGLVGTQKELGKPIGSDIREGKRTAIVDFALRQASDGEKSQLLQTLVSSGNMCSFHRDTLN